MKKQAMKNKKKIFLALFPFLFHMPICNAKPKEAPPGSESRLAIVVGKKAISAYDLHQRLRLAALSSGLQDTQEILEKIKNAIISMMIDEHLQMQEAEGFNLDVSSEEIQQVVSNLEKANNMPPGAIKKFLSAQKIPFKVMENQIRAGLLWVKYIQGKYIPSLQVRSQDIDTYLKILQANQGKTHYHLAEIVLYVENPTEEKKVYEQAVHLIQMLQQGAPFPNVAQQFSKAPTSQKGGDMGWVTAEELEVALQEPLKKQEIGRFSGPWRTAAGFTILALIEKQDPAQGKTIPLPSREEILQVLQSERLELFARRELSQLRRKVFVEVRS